MLEITAVNEYQDMPAVRVRCPSCGATDWVFLNILLGFGIECQSCNKFTAVSTEDVQEFIARMTEVINVVSGSAEP